MNSAHQIYGALFLMTFVTSALCEEKSVSSKPIVLMLTVESEVPSPLQETFRNELSMELSTHKLLTKSMRGFSDETLSARLEDIRQMGVACGAEVVIWLEKTHEDTVSLNVLAAASDRSMLRSVGATLSGKDTGGELAIAARELLEELHIPLKENPSIHREDAPPALSPSSSNERNALPKPTPPSEIDRSYRPRIWMFLGPVTTGGFSGTAKAPILLGGAFSIGIHWKSGPALDLSIEAFTNPSSTLQYGTFRTVGVRPGVGIGYLWERGLVRIGPTLGLQVPWQTARAKIGSNRESEESWWNFRLVQGFDLRIRLHRNIFFSMMPGLGILVHQEVFERVTDGVDIYVSPYLEWHLRCGIIIGFN
jgi:hypothetical protein